MREGSKCSEICTPQLTITRMWFPLLSIQVLVLGISAQDFRYVKPNTSSPVNCPGQPCYALDHYTKQTDRYFTNGSTFAFLAGNHSLQTVLSLTAISDITMRGNSFAVRIFLGKKAGIVCRNVSDFYIEGLTFVLCEYKCQVALNVLYSIHIVISNSTFHGSGYSTWPTFTWSSALNFQHSNVTILNSTFEGTSDITGGAIEALDDSIVTITGSVFTRNSAFYSGGAIYVHRGSSLILEGNLRNKFESNFGSSKGGAIEAIDCDKCTLIMAGFNVFQNNYIDTDYGGAVSVIHGKLMIMPGNTSFYKNWADDLGGVGGAIGMSCSVMSCDSASTLVFEGNRAEHGGGMYMETSSADTSNCSMNFISNIAKKYGGGIMFGKIYLRLSTSRDTCTDNESLLSGNFVNNSAARGGGVFIVNEKKIITLSNINITGNSDTGLCILDSNNVIFDRNNRIVTNTGGLGGGIYSIRSTLSFIGHTFLEGNTALRGGGLYIQQGTVFFNKTTIFAHNTAERDGGALYATEAVINVQDIINFTFNLAQNGKNLHLLIIHTTQPLTMVVQYTTKTTIPQCNAVMIETL